MPGPLAGLKVVEIAGMGPAPYGCMLLADLGADVVRVDRSVEVGKGPRPSWDVLRRGRRSVGVDLKAPGGAEVVLRLVEEADALVEPFRPGVAERLGIGPDACLARNPKLVYARMTGWGQDGPLAAAAGHDINYAAVAGGLFHWGREGQPPTPPLNLAGDFGGGGMLLAFGLLAGVLDARTRGAGQVVDVAMVDGVASQMAMFHGARAIGAIDEDRRGTNLLDSGAPFYDSYECADGEWVAVGPIEPHFYSQLLALAGLADEELPQQNDPAGWPVLRARLSAVFRARTRDEWAALAEGTDACLTPVLRMSEAVKHPPTAHRQAFAELDGIVQPAPAPRFSATPGALERPPAAPGEHTDEILADWLALPSDEVAALHAHGTVA
jgi:alpha-methylacyl-CoA racemase